MFFLKKLLSRFLFPVPLCVGLLLLGLLLWSFTKRKKCGRGLVVAGTLLLLAFSYPLLPRLALSHLESQYPPLAEFESQRTEVGGQKLGGEAPRFIMVLGQDVSADTNRPPAARFADEALKRIIEGVRLHRLLTNSTLLVSVSGPTVTQEEKQRVMGELLLIFGLPTNAVKVCASAWDTEDEVRWCKNVVGTNRVIIVSSASHLPRAMLLGRKSGLNAVAAPSGFLVDTVTQSPFSPGWFFPSSFSLYKSERAMNEYLGLAWERVRGAKASEQKVESKK
jgi:uncharacterized SAM-binding protein YcdF (DUF218 family)